MGEENIDSNNVVNKSELNETVTKYLEESTQEAFSTKLSDSLEMTEETILPINNESLISSIGFTGTIEGSIAFCLDNKSACSIVSKMLDMEITEMDAEVRNGIGKIVNIIIGGIKMRMGNVKHNFEIGIPTVIKGIQLEVFGASSNLTKVIKNFTCQDMKFSVVFMYKIHEEKEGTSNYISKEPADAQKEEEKLNPLEALQQSAEETESAGGEEVSEAETKPNPLEDLQQTAEKVELQEQQEEPAEKEEEKKVVKAISSGSTHTSAMDKLDQAMKNFKESN